MRKILIATILPAAMLVACSKPAEPAADANNVATEEVVAPSETADNMDANAMDANATDMNATDQGSTDQRPAADATVDGSTDQAQ